MVETVAVMSSGEPFCQAATRETARSVSVTCLAQAPLMYLSTTFAQRIDLSLAPPLVALGLAQLGALLNTIGMFNSVYFANEVTRLMTVVGLVTALGGFLFSFAVGLWTELDYPSMYAYYTSATHLRNVSAFEELNLRIPGGLDALATAAYSEQLSYDKYHEIIRSIVITYTSWAEQPLSTFVSYYLTLAAGLQVRTLVECFRYDPECHAKAVPKWVRWARWTIPLTNFVPLLVWDPRVIFIGASRESGDIGYMIQLVTMVEAVTAVFTMITAFTSDIFPWFHKRMPRDPGMAAAYVAAYVVPFTSIGLIFFAAACIESRDVLHGVINEAVARILLLISIASLSSSLLLICAFAELRTGKLIDALEFDLENTSKVCFEPGRRRAPPWLVRWLDGIRASGWWIRARGWWSDQWDELAEERVAQPPAEAEGRDAGSASHGPAVWAAAHRTARPDASELDRTCSSV